MLREQTRKTINSFLAEGSPVKRFTLNCVNECGFRVGVGVCISYHSDINLRATKWCKLFCQIDDTKWKCTILSQTCTQRMRVCVAEAAFTEVEGKVKSNLMLFLCAHTNNCFYSTIKGYFQAHPDRNLTNAQAI